MNWDSAVTPWQALGFLYAFGAVMLVIAVSGLRAAKRNKPHDSASHSD
ncbi:MAG: hypothetical protein ACRD3E_01450 [Terriglobales bacterium]